MDLILNYYLQHKRRQSTFQKLYENHSLNYSQVDRLKTAVAAHELIPMLVYSPYMIVMLRKCGQANSSSKIVSTIALGLIGFVISEGLSIHFGSQVWWPIVAQVYSEIIIKQRQRDQVDESPTEEHTQEQIIEFKNESDSFRVKIMRLVDHFKTPKSK